MKSLKKGAAKLRRRNVADRNPVLYGGLSLPFLVVACTRLDNALALCWLMIACLPVIGVGFLLRGRCSLPVRRVACAVCGMVLVQLAALPLRGFPLLIERLGIYLPLVSINMIVLSLALEQEAPLPVLIRRGVRGVLGFGVVACALGALREAATQGTVLGFSLGITARISGLALPFAGLIGLGMVCALLRSRARWVRLRAYRRLCRSKG